LVSSWQLAFAKVLLAVLGLVLAVKSRLSLAQALAGRLLRRCLAVLLGQKQPGRVSRQALKQQRNNRQLLKRAVPESPF
jgi:hypothetical protein